jgi:hypothetical protein
VGRLPTSFKLVAVGRIFTLPPLDIPHDTFLSLQRFRYVQTIRHEPELSFEVTFSLLLQTGHELTVAQH